MTIARPLFVVAALVSALLPAAAGERLVTFAVENVTLAEVASAISAKAGVRVEVAEELRTATVTLSVTDLEVEKALDLLAALVGPGVRARRLAEDAWRIEPVPKETWRERVGRLLDETRVNVDFADTPLADVLAYLAEFAGATLILDPFVARERSEDELLVQLRAEDVTIRDGLALVTALKGLASDLRFGGVFVSTPERLKALPKTLTPEPGPDPRPDWERRLSEALARPVTYAFAEASIPDVLEFLGAVSEVRIVVGRAVRGTLGQVTTSATVTDLPLGDALAGLLVPHGFGIELTEEGLEVVPR